MDSMHRLLRRIYQLAVFLTALTMGGGMAGAGQNAVQPLELVRLDQMLAADSGSVAVVFIAAWCMPCIEELPDVNALYKKYSAKGLNVLGLSLDLGGPQAIQPFVDHHKLQFPVYWVGEKAIKAYNIKGIPLILLFENGKITQRIMGKRSKKELDRIFAKFLK